MMPHLWPAQCLGPSTWLPAPSAQLPGWKDAPRVAVRDELEMAHPWASSAFPYCHRLPLLAAETVASLGSKRSSLPSWPSPCSHHPVTSGTRGPR